MLNLNQLTQFLGIVRAGSLAAAAQELEVSAAALSKSLAALEYQLGIQLFDRVGRGLQLTRVGSEFAGQVAELLGHADAVAERLRQSASGDAGSASIGCGPLALQGPVTGVIDQIMREVSGITLNIETGHTTDLLQGLHHYRYDFLVTDVGALDSSDRLDSCLVHPLPAERLVLVSSRAHPLAKQQNVSLADTLDYPWVTPKFPSPFRRALLAQLRAEHAPAEALARLARVPDVRIEDMNSCMQVAETGQYLAATLASKVAGESFPRSLQALPVVLNISTNIAVVSLRNRTPSPLASRIMGLLAESATVTFSASRR